MPASAVLAVKSTKGHYITIIGFVPTCFDLHRDYFSGSLRSLESHLGEVGRIVPLAYLWGFESEDLVVNYMARIPTAELEHYLKPLPDNVVVLGPYRDYYDIFYRSQVSPSIRWSVFTKRELAFDGPILLDHLKTHCWRLSVLPDSVDNIVELVGVYKYDDTWWLPAQVFGTLQELTEPEYRRLVKDRRLSNRQLKECFLNFLALD